MTILTSPDTEGEPGVARVEAFSDGVVAIIITIMVLELKAPEQHGWAPLLRLWPTGIAYALSFAYVGIYWANHHRLFSHATRVTNALVWSNMLLLFALSLVPFATAYLGEQHFTRQATLVYLVTMLLPAFCYPWLQRVIRHTGRQGSRARGFHKRMIRKAVMSNLIYAAAIPLTFLSPALGITLAALVAILWFLPEGPLDRLFAGRWGGQEKT